MAGSQISTSVTIINSLLGFQAVSLTNMDTSAQSLIAAGSKVEIASAFFTFASNETPNATSWTAVTTGNTAYITLTPAGSAGSQTVTAEYTDTAPTWSTSKQGWYASAASTTRYVGGVTKTSATQYDDAFILGGGQERLRFEENLLVGGALTVSGAISATASTFAGNVGVTGTLTASTAIEGYRVSGRWFTHEDTVSSVPLPSDTSWTTVDSVIGTNAIGLACAYQSSQQYFQMFAFSRGGVTEVMKHGGGQDCFRINGTALEGRAATSSGSFYARYIVFNA